MYEKCYAIINGISLQGHEFKTKPTTETQRISKSCRTLVSIIVLLGMATNYKIAMDLRLILYLGFLCASVTS